MVSSQPEDEARSMSSAISLFEAVKTATVGAVGITSRERKIVESDQELDLPEEFIMDAQDEFMIRDLTELFLIIAYRNGDVVFSDSDFEVLANEKALFRDKKADFDFS